MDGTRSNSPYSSYPSSQYPAAVAAAAGANLPAVENAAAGSTNASAPALPPLTRGGQVSLKIQLVSVLSFKKILPLPLVN